jgi:hypothetical protein
MDFLMESSLSSLQDLELAALNRSSNLGKGVKAELEQWVEQKAIAMLARWLIQHREALLTWNGNGQKVVGSFERLLEEKKTA